ncbi:MAG: hypothetical protein QW732_08340 [Zestosphaera sp.]
MKVYPLRTLVNQLIKSELRSLINEVELTLAHRSIISEALSRIVRIS